MPIENTMPYTRMKSRRLTATLGAPTGEVASVVRKIPVTAQGCRPVSVTIQPQITATKPSHQTCCAGQRYHRVENKRPRHHNQTPVRAVKIINKPMPTMARNAKKGGSTGGRSCGGTLVRPGNRPSQL